jgi:hypothetical protein
MGELWIIISDTGDFWSDEYGWTANQSAATLYGPISKDYASLPYGGRWRQISRG